MRENEITFIVPFFGECKHRLKNLDFVLSKIVETCSNILVIEQVYPDQTNTPASSIAHNRGAKYSQVKIDHHRIHKSLLINQAARECETPFMWINDSDCYMNYNSVVPYIEFDADFIQPYKISKDLTTDETSRILSGENVTVEFNSTELDSPAYKNKDERYVSLFGALTFICSTKSFFDIGGMDETFCGWGSEDKDLCLNVLTSDKSFKIKENKACHLNHPRSDTTSDDYLINLTYLNKKWGVCNRTELNKHVVRSVSQQKLEKTAAVIGIARTGTKHISSSVFSILGLSGFGEPFNYYGVIKKPNNVYRRWIDKEDYEAYTKAILSKEKAIKHLQYSCVRLDSVLPENKRLIDVMRGMDKTLTLERDIVVFTTRLNFLDWITSMSTSINEGDFSYSKYSGSKYEITKSQFEEWYQAWYFWHNVRLPELINLRKETGKYYTVIDYDTVNDQELFNQEISEIPEADMSLLCSKLKRQKVSDNNSDYIKNYSQVVSWYRQKNKKNL